MSDFPVSATNAHLEDAQFYISVVLDFLFWDIDNFNAASCRKDS